MEYGFASPKHREFPPMVVVSIVNFCNLRCVHCHYPRFAARPDFRRHSMEWDLWQKLCDEIAAHPWAILNLGTDGEPLLHKRLLDMLRYAKARGISPINITTNGVRLEGELAETLLREGLLDVINISLDAFSEEAYRRIRGGSYKRVLRNTLYLIELRDRLNPRAKIQVNIIDQPEVSGELERFVEYWTPRVDNVLVRTFYGATSVTGATGPDPTGKQKAFEPVERWPCQQFWRRFNVADDGVARFCVDDWYNVTRVGDLREATVAEIWQGAEYERLRELHRTGQFHKIPYCAKCTEWQGMKWDYDYFVALEKMLGRKML